MPRVSEVLADLAFELLLKGIHRDLVAAPLRRYAASTESAIAFLHVACVGYLLHQALGSTGQSP